MIGVDTNVLARLFVDDDQEQMKHAQTFFQKRTPDDPAFIGSVVIAEFVWLLLFRYRYPVDAVHRALDVIFASANVVVEDEEDVRLAILAARQSGADIADSLIAAVAGKHGCRSVVTFDRKAAKSIPGMELLA